MGKKEESTKGKDYLQTAYKSRKMDFYSTSRTRRQPMSATSLWYFSNCIWINDRDLSLMLSLWELHLYKVR